MKASVVVCVFILFIAASVAKFPSQFTKCKQGTPELSKCIVDNIKIAIKFLLEHDGDPKFKLGGISPLKVEKIELQATPQLKIKLTDVKFRGIDKIVPYDASYNSTDNRAVTFKGHLEIIELTGKYAMDGKILILPITGEGDFNITIVDSPLEYKVNLTEVTRKGKTYLMAEPEKSKLSIPSPKRVYFQFKNLFNGDERLGTEMNKFVDENWKEIYAEVQDGIESTAAISIVGYFLNGYLHQIPEVDLID